MKVYKCNQCGNLIAMISASGVPVMCCGKPMEEVVPNAEDESAEKLVCDLKPLDLDATENYVVCKCNQVSYFDILDSLQKHSSIENLLDVFDDVKNTTHCSTGCGGCYEKVIAIISEALNTGKH
jgi:desulfoferrodoxin-like iron-binding protein